MDLQAIYQLALDHGLAADKAKVAAAVAMAESGGNPNAHNATPPDDSYGLWQINMLGALGPARRFTYRLSKNEDLYDPDTNARVMSSLSHQGQNFSPWTTYTSGKYKQYLNANVNTPPPAAGGGDSPGIVDTAIRAGDALSRTAKWITTPRSWLRVAFVIGGGLLIYASVETLVLPYTTKAVGTVMGAASPVAKGARKLKGAVNAT